MGFSLKSIFKAPKNILEGIGDIINPKKPKYPKLPPEKVMPVGDEAEKRKARRRSIAQQRARSGRASTIMSQGEKLG